MENNEIKGWLNLKHNITEKLNELIKEFGFEYLIEYFYLNESIENVIKQFLKVQFVNKKCENIKKIGTFYYRLSNGGIEKVIALLIPIWLNMGYDVYLFLDEEQTCNEYELPQNVTRIILPKSGGDRMRVLDKYIKLYNIDIVIYHSWMSKMLFWDLLIIKGNEIPFILYTHGVFSTVYKYRDLQTEYIHLIYKFCDLVLTLTEVSRQFYCSLGIRSICITNPIDKALQNVKRSSLNNKNILWIGRFSDEKRPMEAIEIFKEVFLRVNDAKLIMAGSENVKIENKIKKFIKKYKLGQNVILTGYQRDVLRFYEESSIYLMTSEVEGFSLTLLESKAFGLPCVMYELPYLELTKGNKGIVSVEQMNRDALINILVDLLTNKMALYSLGEEAKKSFMEICNIDIEEQWKTIVTMSYKKEIYEENVMLKVLIQHMNEGTISDVNIYKNSYSYRLGKLLLKIPQILLDWILFYKGR